MTKKCGYDKAGGKFLGEGTYGCVFDPPLQCSTETARHPSGVGKIFENEEELQDEENELMKIKVIDPTGKYSVHMKKKCKVKSSSIEKSDHFDKCSKFNIASKKKSLYDQIILKDKGVDLYKFAGKKFKFMDIIDGVINAAEGLVEFEKKKYCHRDIKPSNIIVTQPSNNILFIDFGLSIDYDDIYDFNESWEILTYSYFYFPPEFDFCAHQILDSNDYSALLDKIYRKYKDIIILFNYIGINYDTLQSQFETFYKYLYMTSKDVFDKKKDEETFQVFKEYSNVVDVFSFGITLLELITNPNCDFTDMTSTQQDTLKNIVKQSTNFNPRERYNPTDLLHYLKLLKSDKEKLVIEPIIKPVSPPPVNNKNPRCYHARR